MTASGATPCSTQRSSASVRHSSVSAPLHNRTAGSKPHFVGSSSTPSVTPSRASQAASTAVSIAFNFFAGMYLAEGVRRSAGDDAVVIIGIALRLHQRLPPAVRATGEIRALRPVAIERLDDQLGFFGHFVNRAIAVIRNLF